MANPSSTGGASLKHPQLPLSLIGKFFRSQSRSLLPSQAQETLLNPFGAHEQVLTPACLAGKLSSQGFYPSLSLSQRWVGAHLQWFQVCQGFALTSSAWEGAVLQGLPSKPPALQALSPGGWI